MKTYNVRVELDLMLSVDVQADDEQQAEDFAMDFIRERLYNGKYCGLTVFEEANSEDAEAFVTSWGMDATDVEERDYT